MINTTAMKEDATNLEYPFLEIKKPGVEEYIFHFEKIIRTKNEYSVTIGRGYDNDLVLYDPEKKVSRQHCILEYSAGYWWVVDESSSNGTFVQTDSSTTEVDVRRNGRFKLSNGNTILILSQWIEPDEPVFWRLTFRDPGKTETVGEFQQPPQYKYSLSQEKLFRVTSVERQEVDLRPLERDLIHYMARQNQTNGQSVVCLYEDLIKALWDESFNKSNNDITYLVWGIRNKIESDSGQSRILQTIKGRGYLLDIDFLD